MDAIEEKAFILKDKKLRNLQDLYSAISELTDEEYSHYASLHHNYFADWIQYVLEQKELADELRSADSRTDALGILNQKPKETKKSKPVPETKSVQKEEIKPLKAETIGDDTPKDQELNHKILSKDYSEMDMKEMKHLLWHHHPWEMAKEFMYGMSIGIIMGLIISRIILP